MKHSLRIIGLLLTISCALFASKHPSQDKLLLNKIENTHLNYNENEGPEKIYLHTDKAYYNLGDIIWFSAYLLDASNNKPLPGTNVLYVDILDRANHIMESTIVKIENGVGYGDFLTTRRYTSGRYMLRAYTNYMQNFDRAFFFRKEIYIDNPLETITDRFKVRPVSKVLKEDTPIKPQIDVRLFPEGGDMVEGLWGKVGVKAVGPDGLGIKVLGEVVTSDGSNIVSFQTTVLGMGNFEFIPMKGKNYSARVFYKTDTLLIGFPKAISKGPSIRVTEKRDHFVIQVHSNEDRALNGFQLICTTRKGAILQAEIKERRNTAVVYVPKKTLETGILSFTLVDALGIPRCERLAFYNSDPIGKHRIVAAPKVTIKFHRNDSVHLKISGSSLPGAKLSIAVTHSAARPSETQGDICSYLLLESELKGQIENPGYYFYSKDPKRMSHLDNLMLTQGWRRFILDDKPLSPLAYHQEHGITISGQVWDSPKRKRHEMASVLLLAADGGKMGYGTVFTDKNGRFEFSNVDLLDETRLTIQAKKSKSTATLFVELDTITPPIPLKFEDTFQKGMIRDFEDFLAQPGQKDYIDAAFFHPEGLVELKEVEVTATKKDKTEKWLELRKVEMAAQRHPLYKNSSYTIDTRELSVAQSVLDPLVRVPGAKVSFDQMTQEQYVIIQRTPGNGGLLSEPLYLINGFIVDRQMINTLTIEQVDFIDVFKGTRAAIFGNRGFSGAVAVYTKNGKGTDPPAYTGKSKVVSLTYHGFHTPREFYEAKFKAKDNDQGSTLYWKPDIKFGDNQLIELKFPKGERSGTYYVDVQGVTLEGVPLKTKTSFVIP